jgi:hypothetical protein
MLLLLLQHPDQHEHPCSPTLPFCCPPSPLRNAQGWDPCVLQAGSPLCRCSLTPKVSCSPTLPFCCLPLPSAPPPTHTLSLQMRRAGTPVSFKLVRTCADGSSVLVGGNSQGPNSNSECRCNNANKPTFTALQVCQHCHQMQPVSV